MRIRTALPAIIAAAVIGMSSVAQAGKDEVKVKTHKQTRADFGERWDRGEWTQHDTVTVRSERPAIRTRSIDEGVTVRERSMERGLAGRQFSGPYRYFFTDQEGKYNYYLDRYGYPYQYGGTEIELPVGVLGDVPPEYIGGGPVRYFRAERPLSQSVYDR